MFPVGNRIEYALVVATTVPSVRAVITFLPNLGHPPWPNRGRYMPHIVGDPGERKAKMSGNTIIEHYLGFLVADAPDEIPPGGTVEVSLELMYWSGERYEEFVPGATFTLREGPKIVGFGRVLSVKSVNSGPVGGKSPICPVAR